MNTQWERPVKGILFQKTETRARRPPYIPAFNPKRPDHRKSQTSPPKKATQIHVVSSSATFVQRNRR
jgi:hypothetical protein